MFETLSSRLEGVVRSLRGKGRLSEDDIADAMREIRIALLEADVALPVVRTFVARVQARAVGQEVSAALNPAQQVVKIVNEELVGILGGSTAQLTRAKHPPTVVMLAGLQGAGKTTLAGKLALHLSKARHSPLLVAADLQRPNAVEQLTIVGQQAGVAVFAPEPGNGVGDPVAVATDALAHARRLGHDIVIIDTAGRLGIDAEMMAQAAAIRDATSPQNILFVLDAMIGQDAVATAQAFADGVGFTGVVLTKLDGDARGGAALSVRELTGVPILYASTGEKLSDFDVFHPDRMASRILGMGDVLTLIEQAEQAFDRDSAQEMAGRLAGGGELTLEDFLEQMLAIRKMGSIGNVLGMLPGMGQVKDQLSQVDDKDIDRITAIIRSMTPDERADPKIINGSRRLRIAKGSGVTVTEVNSLVDRFFEARKMMKQMPGMGGRKGKGKKAKPAKGRQRSGRPGAAAPVREATPQLPADLLGGGGLGSLGLPGGFQLPGLPKPPGAR